MLLPSKNFYCNKERSYDNVLICINGKPIILYLFHDSVNQKQFVEQKKTDISSIFMRLFEGLPTWG